MGGAHSVLTSGLGDVFFPANARRRDRAVELEADIRLLGINFETEKRKYDALEKEVARTIDTYLASHGYSSFEALDAKLHEVLDSDALTDWEDLKSTLKDSSAVGQAILRIEGIVAIAAPIIAGAAVAVGAVTMGAGLAAVGIAGAASTVVLLVLGIAAVIVGKINKERLNDAIEDLFYARADAQLQVNRIGLMNEFVIQMLSHMQFTGDDKLQHFDTVFERLQLLGADVKWSINTAYQALREQDTNRGSHTEFDPAPRVDMSELALTTTKTSLWRAADLYKNKIPTDGGRAKLLKALAAETVFVSKAGLVNSNASQLLFKQSSIVKAARLRLN